MLKKIVLIFRPLILLYLILIVVFISVSLIFYYNQRSSERNEKENYIRNTTNLTAHQIEEWYAEHLKTAKLIFSQSINTKLLTDYLRKPTSENERKLQILLNELNDTKDYLNILLYTPQNGVCYSFTENGTTILSEIFKQAKDKKKIEATTIYLDEQIEQYVMDIYVPIKTNEGIIGAVILKIDPSKNLFPLLSNWKSSSTTGEAIIVTKEVDSLVFLSPLRFKESYKIVKRSLKDTFLPAVKVTEGKRGIITGRDYRGVNVIADVRSINNTPWFLVVKMDTTEIYEQVTGNLYNNLIILIVVFVTSGFSFLLLNYRTHEKTIKTVHEAEEKFNSIFQNSSNAIVLLDEKKIRECNSKAEELFGLKKTEIVGKHPAELSPDFQVNKVNSFDQAEKLLADADRGSNVNFEWIHKNNGSLIHTDVTLSTVEFDNKSYILAFLFDITQSKKAQLELERSEQKYKNIFNNNPQPMWVYDLKTLKFLDVNEAAINHYGYSFDEFLSMTIKDIRPESDVQKLLENLATTSDKLSKSDVWRHKKKNGEEIFAEITSHKIDYENRSVRLVLANDITDRIQAQMDLIESDSIFNQFMENSPVYIFFKDSELRPIKLSSNYEEMLGKPIEDILGKTMNELFPTELAESMIEADKRVIEEQKVLNIREELNGRQFQTTKFPIIIGNKPSYLAGFTVDITEQKRFEDRLNKINEELELIVKERTAELETANKELEAFSYSVSHDLRSPLRAISGFTKILMEDHGGEFKGDMKELFEDILKNTEDMNQLIDDLLEFSRLSRKELSKSSIDMERLFSQTFEEHNIIIKDRNISIKIDQLPMGFGDYVLIKQVIRNLVSNAIKFTSKNHNATIIIRGEENHSECIYSIIDNGVGFDMKYVDKIFGVFHRLHSISEFEGTGVGLAIVHRIITRHEGRIWVESEVDKGTNFYFALKKPGR